MKKVLRELFSTGLYLLVVLLLTSLVIRYIGQRTMVEGISMEPTLYHRQNLILHKQTYPLTDPKRIDIVVFPFKYKEKTNYIKRIIGLPGETVQIDEYGCIYINGEILPESYGKEIISSDRIGLAYEPIVLGEDEYFVMGDNRNHSTDSRTEVVGNVKRSEIIGRAWLRIWPFSRFGFISHQ